MSETIIDTETKDAILDKMAEEEQPSKLDDLLQEPDEVRYVTESQAQALMDRVFKPLEEQNRKWWEQIREMDNRVQERDRLESIQKQKVRDSLSKIQADFPGLFGNA